MGYIERSSEVEELVNTAEALAATMAAVLEPDGNFKMRGQVPDSEIQTRVERVQRQVRQVRDRLGYNGYRNHGTWTVLVWLNSDEQRRQRARDTVQKALQATGHIGVASAHLMRWLAAEMEQVPWQAGVFIDLLHGTLDSVDWHKIAERFAPDDYAPSAPYPIREE